MPRLDLEKIASDPHAAARSAGLRYVSGRKKGLTRRKRGRGFSYYTGSGELLRDPVVRERIESLAIPPAWSSVWICADLRGHLQASGKDDRGRKQYIYHPLYRAVRDVGKFHRMRGFAQALPKIRRRIRRDLALPALPRDRVLAAIVRLIDASYIRIGNARYQRENQSYGVTTMLNKHLAVDGETLRLRFTGKSGKQVDRSIKDKRLASILKRCRELPGKHLFQYREDGRTVRLDSGDVNNYLFEISKGHFTAKDFRTWGGTTLACSRLRQLGPATSKRQVRKNVNEAYRAAAEILGNTVAVCKKYYVHPAVISAYEAEETDRDVRLRRREEGGAPDSGPATARARRALHHSGELRASL